MDLTALCGMYICGAEMTPIASISVLMESLSSILWLRLPTLHPYRSACGTDLTRKGYLKWWEIEQAIPSPVDPYIDHE